MMDRIKNLHLLLRVPSFTRMPLSVHFFCEDIYRLWQSWDDRCDTQIRDGVNIHLDWNQLDTNPPSKDQTVPTSQARNGDYQDKDSSLDPIERLDVTYAGIKGHLEKSTLLLAADGNAKCDVCALDLTMQGQTVLICPHRGCRTATHPACLAKVFLSKNQSQDLLVPTSGKCPGCNRTTAWVDLVKELSLRSRGEKEVAVLMKKSRRRKDKFIGSENDLDGVAVGHELLEEQEGLSADDEPLGDDWQPLDTDDDNMSISGAASDISEDDAPERTRLVMPRLEIVIEDSDSDDMHI